MMKKFFSLLRLAIVMALTILVSGMFFSCTSEGDEPDQDSNDQGLNVYPWKDHPKSYIRLFDNRMELSILSVRRNGPAVQVEYTLTNVHFGEDVTLSFYLNSDGAHDDLGNTYGISNIMAFINGGSFGDRYNSRDVIFKPNQTIKGSFTIKNFDRNATAFSLSIGVINKTSDIVIADERLDFVNIPVPEGESLETYPWPNHPESYIKSLDYRFDFKVLSLRRNGPMLEIEYSLTNTGFDKDIKLRFYLNNDAGHDNLGNTYSISNVKAYINGGSFGDRYNSREVTFRHNQSITGTLSVMDFNKKAPAFSIDINVTDNNSDVVLATDKIEFVNIPAPAEESIEVYPWENHPASYISKIDARFDFKMLSVKRKDTTVEIEYSLTNTGFDKDIKLGFYLNDDAGHDNLGNTYSISNVKAYINGGNFGGRYSSRDVTFRPNQSITGTLSIENFNKNANSLSIDVNVSIKTPDLVIATDKLEFVNIPVPE